MLLIRQMRPTPARNASGEPKCMGFTVPADPGVGLKEGPSHVIGCAGRGLFKAWTIDGDYCTGSRVDARAFYPLRLVLSDE